MTTRRRRSFCPRGSRPCRSSRYPSRRWGGHAVTRYNWMKDETLAAGAEAVLTVPLI